MRATVVIIGADAADTARSLESVRTHAELADATVLIRPQHDPAPWSDVAEGAVVFVRSGDRVCAAGALLAGLVDADVALGGHRIAGRGHWGIDVTAPTVADVAQLAGWAVAPPFELSTLAVRRRCLPPSVRPAPGLPGGEVAVLHAALTASGRAARSVAEIVADVRIRPEHTGDVSAVLRQLHGVLTGPLGQDHTTASAVRRRALSLAYLESGPPVSGQFDADAWWGPALVGPDAASVLAVVRDLQWALTCLADAHRIQFEGLDGLAEHAVSDITAESTPDLASALITAGALHLHVAELTDTIRWLHAEVRHRDEQIASHQPVPSTPDTLGPRVEELRTVELGQVLLRRVAGALRRTMNRGRP